MWVRASVVWKQTGCVLTAPPAPASPVGHTHFARHADDGLQQLLHLVKPGLYIAGVPDGNQA